MQRKKRAALLTQVVIQVKINMRPAIKIIKIHKDLKVEGMVTKPVTSVTDEGEIIYEDNLQLELKNIGKKPISFIDCTISYRNNNGDFIGSDSDGTFDELKPNNSCISSMPFFIPENTVKKDLEIKVKHKERNFLTIKIGLIAAMIIIGLIIKEFN